MLSTWMVVAHVWTVLWLVCGVVGRGVSYRRAGQADDLAELRTLARLGGIFERTMVRPGTFAVLVTGLLAAWVRGDPILGFLQGRSGNWVLASLLLYLTFVPLVIFVFLPRGRVYRAALEDASRKGTLTPELKAAISDPAVEGARVYEIVVVAALAYLMVAKPF